MLFRCPLYRMQTLMRSRLTGRPFVWRVLLICLLFGSFNLPAAEAVEFDLHMRNQQVEGSAAVIHVNQGDRVRLNWSSDQSLSVHLHGYDIELALTAGTDAVMSF